MAPQVIQELSWWQVGAGVLSIPATLLGLAYTWALIRKTKLESRKIQLEIVEKEAAAFPTATSSPQVSSEALIPSKVQRALLVIIVAFNVAVVFFYGLKTRPLYGLEVLQMVLAAVVCVLVLELLMLLQMQRMSRNLLDTLEVIAGIIAALRRTSQGSDER